jgi:hypothetical protein
MKSPYGLLLLLLAGCAGSPDSAPIRKEPLPEAEQHELDLKEAEQRRRDFQMVLIKLDQAMENHAQSLSNRGAQRADMSSERTEKFIRETVLDIGPAVVTKGQPAPPPGENFRRLQAAAADSSDPHNQGIALAALGFSGSHELMPLILQGAQLDDQKLVDRAVFGLAMLRAPTTPPGVLAAIAENQKLPEASRTQAAWAIYRLQDVSDHREEIVALWLKLLAAPQGLPGGVLVQAVRGIGLERNATHAALVAPFLRNPVPMVRMVTADALARMNAQDHAAELIALIGPEEPMPNVRLHARKALQELAGHVDYGYDVEAWRKAFDRGK